MLMYANAFIYCEPSTELGKIVVYDNSVFPRKLYFTSDLSYPIYYTRDEAYANKNLPNVIKTWHVYAIEF